MRSMLAAGLSPHDQDPLDDLGPAALHRCGCVLSFFPFGYCQRFFCVPPRASSTRSDSHANRLLIIPAPRSDMTSAAAMTRSPVQSYRYTRASRGRDCRPSCDGVRPGRTSPCSCGSTIDPMLTRSGRAAAIFSARAPAPPRAVAAGRRCGAVSCCGETGGLSLIWEGRSFPARIWPRPVAYIRDREQGPACQQPTAAGPAQLAARRPQPQISAMRAHVNMCGNGPTCRHRRPCRFRQASISLFPRSDGRLYGRDDGEECSSPTSSLL